MKTNAVETHHLTKYYGKARGISDLTLTVEEGEFFGFIGPNGAGKSTTIRLIMGLIRPTGGGIKILGKELSQKSSPEILADIGYIPSEAMFYSGATVQEILNLSSALRRKDCSAEARILCERLQLDVSRKTEDLSLGNRKKTAIVCALQHRPKLCIFDEPTSGLDPLIQKEFFQVLKERNQEGTTVFLSSHVLSEVQEHCTRAAVIREGSLAACGSISELARTNAKRITLYGVGYERFQKAMPAPVLKQIRDLQASPASLSFLYRGSIKELADCLVPLPYSDLTITEPDLNEIFMHYYEGGFTHDSAAI